MKTTSPIIKPTEKFIGHLLGPLGYAFINVFLGSYLNVYYTDICRIGSIWGGKFMSFYPIAVKLASIVTFVLAGALIDRIRLKFGKARPWILLSALLIPVSSYLLFVVPAGNENSTALFVLFSNFLFYGVTATLYSTANTLLVPLSTDDADERSKLSVLVNTQSLISGSFVAMIVPMALIPAIGVSRSSWMLVALSLSVIAAPLLILQFITTKERVMDVKSGEKISLIAQLRDCLKSRSWVLLMIYFLLFNLISGLSNASIFYYCNWVLGEYQDGITQTLFYAIGNAPLGIGVFLCNPICQKLGRRNAMCGGLIISSVGMLLCLLFPHSLPMVLTGQFIKACGAIPSAYLASVLLGDALDHVFRVSGRRCDGFSSSIYNAMITLSGGVAFSILNAGMTALGYINPTESFIPVQPSSVQLFFIICQLGIPFILYPIMAWLLWKREK